MSDEAHIKLNKLGKALFEKGDVVIDIDVGILAEDASKVHPERGNRPEGTAPLGLIAWVHEFGAGGLPRRSWLRDALLGTDNLKQIVDMLIESRFDGNRWGQLLVGYIKRRIIQSANFAPNAPSTIERKGSSMPLVDTGFFRKSIKHVVRKQSKELTALVGKIK